MGPYSDLTRVSLESIEQAVGLQSGMGVRLARINATDLAVDLFHDQLGVVYRYAVSVPKGPDQFRAAVGVLKATFKELDGREFKPVKGLAVTFHYR